jgi:hypothetical protein
MELITTLPSKERFHALIGSLVVAGDIVIIRRRGARGVGGARILEFIEDDLGDCLAHGNSRTAEFPFAEVVTSCIVVIVFYLMFLQSEVAGVALAGEVMAIGMAAAASVGAGVRHLIPEEAVMARDSAPARCRDQAEVVGRFAVSGEVIVPWAVGAAFSLLKLFLG